MFVRNYRLLDYLVEIVDSGSLQGAAERLHVSPPVISKALADLEAVVGSTLLVRSRGKVTLTTTGESIYLHGSRMRAAAEAAMNVSRQLRHDIQGKLRLTLPSELAIHWLPPVLHDFREKYPAVSLEVLASDTKEDLVQQQCDLAIRAFYRLRRAEFPDGIFNQQPVNLLAGEEYGSLLTMPIRKRIASVPFIAFGFDNQRTTLPGISRTSGKRMNLKIGSTTTINSAYLTREMILAGLGMALLIESAADPLLDQGRLIPIAPELDFGWLGLKVIQRDNYPSEPALAFQRHLEAGNAEGA